MATATPEMGRSELENELQSSFQRMVHWHFIACTAFVVVSIAMFFIAYACLVFLFPVPSHDDLLKKLGKSSAEMTRLEQAVAQALPTNTPALTEINAAVLRQAELHAAAVADLRESQKEIPAQGVPLLQLLGGSVVLGLLAYLGLQRLQTIDTEINSLREFMFRQIRERVAETREVLKAAVDDEVDDRFAKTKKAVEAADKEFRQLSEKSMEAFRAASASAEKEVVEVKSRVEAILKRYDWLDSAELRQGADVLSRLTSVEQSHDAAQNFNEKGMSELAYLALRAIVDRNLKGDADDYHNAHAEAMQMKEGATSHPRHQAVSQSSSQ